MKTFLALFLAFSFAFLGSFGFLSMNHENIQRHIACIASLIQGSACPDRADLLNFITFHTKALKKLAMVMFTKDIFLLWAVFLAVFLMVTFVITNFVSLVKFPKNPCSLLYLLLTSSHLSLKQDLSNWLTLKEHSPTFGF